MINKYVTTLINILINHGTAYLNYTETTLPQSDDRHQQRKQMLPRMQGKMCLFILLVKL